MSLSLRITTRAASEIEAAAGWWIENRPFAPLALREEVKAAFTLLLRQPGVGVKVGNTRLAGVRRLHLGRVRYFIYYRVSGSDIIILINVALKSANQASLMK